MQGWKINPRGERVWISDVAGSESRFATFVERLAGAWGHADRVAPLKAYWTGLMLPGERKSVEPMAARVEPGRVRAAHQSLHHFIAKADWADAAVMETVRDLVLPVITKREPIRAWVIDDTGIPKRATIRSACRRHPHHRDGWRRPGKNYSR